MFHVQYSVSYESLELSLMRKQGHRTIRENCHVPAMKTKRLIQSIAIQVRGDLYIDFSGNWIRALVSKLLSGLSTVSV